MKKNKLLQGLNKARKRYDKVLDEKFLKKGESSETTDNSGVKFALGDNPPISNNIIWFDTSEYASIQGATVTQIEPLQSVGSAAIIISDTKPTETNVFWLDTSE